MAGTEKQREEINRKLVSMQMEMIGLTYEDAMNTTEFWRVYTMTKDQAEAWRKQALPLIRKTFKVNKSRGEMIMAMFELDLGLRIDDGRELFESQMKPQAYLLEKLTLWQKIKNFFKSWQ
jgi:hypothetical protein